MKGLRSREGRQALPRPEPSESPKDAPQVGLAPPWLLVMELPLPRDPRQS